MQTGAYAEHQCLSVQPPGGKPVKTADQSGVVFSVPPEAEALLRWQDHEFLEVERLFAKAWRRMIASFDFHETMKGLKAIGINPTNCKTLEEAKAIAESIVNVGGYSLERMKFVFALLGISQNLFLRVWQRWGASFCPPLKVFAPYAAHVLMVEVFFYVAAAANLISVSPKKVTNKYRLSLPVLFAVLHDFRVFR